jgi:ribosome biogenesis GTPase
LLTAEDVLLIARVRGSLMGPRKALGNTVVVGDRVHYEAAPEGGGPEVVVTDVEPRRNAFSRRAPGRHPAEQVVAANLDQVVLVTSVAEPAFSPGLADRVLSQSQRAGIPALLVLNKADLLKDEGGDRAVALALQEDYACAGVPGHVVSSRGRQGIDALLSSCRGRRSLFVGHSGVGKSTLLNAMVPRLELLSGQVNPKTGKGRHTTSAAWLLRPEPGLELVDTPGVRVFGLWGIGVQDLDHTYPEFRPFLGACRFADCAHAEEPGCAVRAAAEQGRLPARRYRSYRKLREELERDESKEVMRQEEWM